MRGVALLLALSGCRSILGIDDGKPKTDAAMPPDDSTDGAGSGSDASTCYGSIIRVCLASAPSAPLTFPASVSINTDSDPRCITPTNGVDACVLAGTSISIAATATLSAHGSRPLVLASTGALTVDGVVDVASHGTVLGAGADSSECTAGLLPLGAGGGAGGSFGTTGGIAGDGAANPSNGGRPGAKQTAPTHLRGGCPGQDGGGSGGARGAGGGAVALIAVTEIKISGTVNASGGGGRGGLLSASGGGGGGGGSGGMVVLDAASLSSSFGGAVIANGGGGGEGSGPGNSGNAGTDASSLQPASGGANGAAAGGDGGDGFGSQMPARDGLNGANTTGGGGGGGGGAGTIRSTQTITSLFSPQPS